MPIHFRSFWPRKNWDSLLAAIAGILIIHSFCRHSGIGVSPDSVDYISTASNIRYHGTATNYSGHPLVNFPIGYPLLLSGIMWITGQDAMSFGPVLNEALFAILILLCGVLMEGFAIRSKLYKWAILTIIVLSPCLLEVYSMLWSETLFLVLLLLFILFLRRYLAAPDAASGLRRLWAPALIAGLACVTRYAGITLIATGGLLLCFQGDLRIRGKMGRLLYFGAAALLLPCLNLLRNRMVTGTAAGLRERGIESFGHVLRDLGNVILGWLGAGEDYGLWAAVLAAVLIVVFALLTIRRRRSRSTEHIVHVFFVVYAAFILGVASISRFQQLDSRLVSPLFIPLIWGCTFWIPGWMSNLYRGMGKPIALFAVFSGVIFIQTAQLTSYAENWEGIRDAGIPGYTENDWTHSQTMDYVRQQFAKDSVPVYSNADDAIWFLTGLRAHTLPHKESVGERGSLMGLDRFYVVWFNDGYNSDLLNIDKIAQAKRMVWTKPFADGAVYYFASR
ncbi:MAG: hypothetical protein Q8927_01905 [Bacteroidota bacterium]|nr:hypothetical protein [Bacteroidota bacterium]